MEIYNQYTNRLISLVSMNEGISIEEMKNMSNVLYALIPDIPLVMGMIKVQIGMAYRMEILNRTIAHTNIAFGKPNMTDIQLSNDINNTLYIKILGEGFKSENDARRFENILTAQYAYNVCGYAEKDYDVVKVLNYFPSVREKMYNRRLDRPSLITPSDITDIMNGKYNDIFNFEEDLMRIGAFNISKVG